MKKAILNLVILLSPLLFTAQAMVPRDMQFVQSAYQCGLFKVKAAELTTAKAKSDSVKVLGRQLLVENTKANEQLKALAVAKNITLLDNLTAEDQKRYDQLAAKSGADFDTSFVQNMITEHKKGIAILKTQEQEGSDAEVRSWASTTLPVLKHHLVVAEDLAVDLDKLSKAKPGGRSGADKVGTLK